MEKVIAYRNLAAQLRREGSRITLERAKQVKLAAANRWEELAAEIEIVIAPTIAPVSNNWIF